MITITNGVNTFTVSHGAYRSIYAAAGYHPVRVKGAKSPLEPLGNMIKTAGELGLEGTEGIPDPEAEISSSQNSAQEDDALDDEDEEYEDLSEIPLNEMGFGQLCEYADQLGLDREGIRSKRELRALIREARG